MTFLETLGIEPIINGVGPATRLGGTNLSAEIEESARQFSKLGFRMDELHMAASDYLRTILAVPGGVVTAGAAAALTIATAVTLTENDSEKMAELPHVTWKPRDVVVQRPHHDPYDHAVTATGAKLVIVGDNLGCSVTELQFALDKEVCAVIYRANDVSGHVPIEQVGDMCKERGISLIVDAAIHVPPVARLRKYFELGARFVAVSGGKGFRGPHTAGVLFCSEQDAVLALLHHLDMDERENTWTYLKSRSVLPITLPTNGIARAMKVGKEEIFQMLFAVQQYLRESEYKIGNEELKIIEDTLTQSGIKVLRYRNEFLNVASLKFFIGDEAKVDYFFLQLQNGTPRIVLGQELSAMGYLTINPMALNRGEGRQIADRVIQLFKESLS